MRDFVLAVECLAGMHALRHCCGKWRCHNCIYTSR